MARPIKDTPMLSAAEWDKLEHEMANVKPVSTERRESIRQAYEWSKSIATFPML